MSNYFSLYYDVSVFRIQHVINNFHSYIVQYPAIGPYSVALVPTAVQYRLATVQLEYTNYPLAMQHLLTKEYLDVGSIKFEGI